MRITAAVIMRNEAVLIASKLVACASWADEIVVVDQRSEDGSAFIAAETLRLLGAKHSILSMRGAVLGKEFSFAQAFEAATGDWVVFTDVDESLVVTEGLRGPLSRVPPDCHAPGILRWHAIANGDRYFKAEEFDRKRFRLLRKPGAIVFEANTSRYKDLVHKHGPVEPRAELPLYDLPREEAFLLEMKAPYQHYADQLFYAATGGRNDRAACEREFAERDLRLGRALYELSHLENPLRRRWWRPWG